MANVLVEEQYLRDIADAIRIKNGGNNTYTPALMATAIDNILQSGMIYPSGTIILGDFVNLTLYKSYTYVSGSNANVGNTISYSSSSNNWRLYKGQIEKDKKYLVVTYHSDSADCKIIIVDNDDKSLYKYTSGNSRTAQIIDTTGYDDSNGLYILVCFDKYNTPTLNQSRTDAGDSLSPYLFVREFIEVQ